MNVTIINRSDALGGAAIASMRLCRALQHQGIIVRMLVIDHRTESTSVKVVSNAAANRLRWFSERLGIFARNGMNRSTLFRIDTATHGVDLARHPSIVDADVLVLGWVNQAMLSLDGVARLAATGKPLVWVMHDMWNCTGVCHHNEECDGFRAACESCPLLPAGSALAHNTWLRKQQLYAKSKIHFVAVSQWLKEQCLASTLMRDTEVSVIANTIDASWFLPTPLRDNPWGVEECRKVVVMGASRLDDPVKGFDRLIAALRWLASERPHVAQRLHLTLYGGIAQPALLDTIPIPHTYLGYVDDLKMVYRHAHIVLSASTRESFGYTLVEGMACGCLAVTTGVGGQTDIVRHLENGYIASSLEPQALAEGLEWAVDANISRESQHQWVAEHYDMPIIAKQHIALYERLCNAADGAV